MQPNKKIAIIGGGASGMTAAIAAKKTNSCCDVTIFEKMDRVGKKLLATGNGRCNLSNINADDISYYHCKNDFVKNALEQFNLKKTLKFFANLGMMTKTVDERIYPYSMQASTVLDALRLSCDRLSVTTVINTPVESIKNMTVNGEKFDKIIIAAGGCASPHLGSDGSGYKLLTEFGHTNTQVFPALTQIKTENTYTKQLKGIKIEGQISIMHGRVPLRTEHGEILFTEYGLSGPPVLSLSRIASSQSQEKKLTVSIDLMPEYSIEKLIKTAIKMLAASKTAGDLLRFILNKRLAEVILKYANIPANSPIPDYLAEVLKAVKNFTIPVEGVMPFKNAQVTAGGISTDEFNPGTLQSKINRNIYAAGEILDVDGECGGFNLQWAFSSGFVAGNHAATTY